MVSDVIHIGIQMITSTVAFFALVNSHTFGVILSVMAATYYVGLVSYALLRTYVNVYKDN